MYARTPARPVETVIASAAAVVYLGLFVTARLVLTAVPPATGFHLDPGLVALLSAVIGGITTVVGAWMVARRRADPAVERLLTKIADLEEQLAQRPAARHHKAD